MQWKIGYPYLEGPVGNAAGRASRYLLDLKLRTSVNPSTTMTKAQEFSIKVQSEDPKKKEKPENEKANIEGAPKPVKDAKGEEEGEELVRSFIQFMTTVALSSTCSQKKISSLRNSLKC